MSLWFKVLQHFTQLQKAPIVNLVKLPSKSKNTFIIKLIDCRIVFQISFLKTKQRYLVIFVLKKREY